MTKESSIHCPIDPAEVVPPPVPVATTVPAPGPVKAKIYRLILLNNFFLYLEINFSYREIITNSANVTVQSANVVTARNV